MSASFFGDKNPRLSFRYGKVPAEVILGFTIGVLTFAIVLAWALQVRAGRLDMSADAALEPIPLEQAAEYDSGCCGDDPEDPQEFLSYCCTAQEIPIPEIGPNFTMRVCGIAENCGPNSRCFIVGYNVNIIIDPVTGATVFTVEGVARCLNPRNDPRTQSFARRWLMI